MNYELPEKYKSNFITRIRSFFNKIFNKNKYIGEDIKIVESRNDIISKQRGESRNDIISKQREESKNHKIRLDILELIERKPEIVKSFSKKRLKELLDIYSIEISNVNQEIVRLESLVGKKSK